MRCLCTAAENLFVLDEETGVATGIPHSGDALRAILDWCEQAELLVQNRFRKRIRR